MAYCFMAAARRRSSDLLGVLNSPGLAHLRSVATLFACKRTVTALKYC
jgi:hypothetical protein